MMVRLECMDGARPAVLCRPRSFMNWLVESGLDAESVYLLGIFSMRGVRVVLFFLVVEKRITHEHFTECSRRAVCVSS